MTSSTQIEGRVPERLAGPEVHLWTTYRTALDRFSRLRDGLVARSLTRLPDEWRLTEPSPLNTAEVLRALFVLEAHGFTHDWVDARALLDRLVRDPACHDDVQVVALALWAAASAREPIADELFERLQRHAQRGFSQSMVLGWAVCALCEYAQVPSRADRACGLARPLVDRLLRNQNARTGLFHSSDRREGLLRRPVPQTTLSAQTYPILGLATFARVFGDRSGLAAATRCADTLATLQGPNGQWWWRYDARSGDIVERYPVYCVNQDSAVPAALRALGRTVATERYEPCVSSGLHWQFAPTEVASPLIDPDGQWVARSVEESTDRFTVNPELYSYQPARFICGVLANSLVAA